MPYLTALENVQMPMMFTTRRRQRERAMELLELVGLGHRKNSKLSSLSGGEQQRVAIAIALANDPKLLLADEPTGSVDVRTSDYLLDTFRALNEELGLTIVIVTHDRHLAKKVNRVVSIRDGKTSSEMIMRQSYRERMKELDGLDDGMAEAMAEAAHEEFTVLDRAGRLQIPSQMLDEIGATSHKVKLEVVDGRIVIAPEEQENTEDKEQA